MGSFTDIEEDEQFCDVSDTVFVAVGNNVEDSQMALLWVAQVFAGKKICVLHVHRNTPVVALMDGNDSDNKLEEQAAKEFQELERQKMHELLHQYLHVLTQAGVKADKVWIEMDNIQKGIIEMIAQHNIRWLVMGAAADKYYSKKMADLKSKKAIFVCHRAPVSCHIWFACKGHLIYTRKGRKERSETQTAPSFQLSNTDIRTELSDHMRLEDGTYKLRFQGPCRSEEYADESEGILREISSGGSEDSSSSTNSEVDNSKSTLLLADEVKSLESLCTKEMSQTKEIKELLEREKEQVKMVKNQRVGFMKELQMVQDKNLILDRELVESQCIVKDLEEKIVAAVELLISFKEKRDKLQVELGEAMREVREQKKLVKVDTKLIHNPQILAFSFPEINEATNNFDPLWKIGEGRYGSVYRGFLRHVHVAIKMLPSYGSQGHFEFTCKVEVLSKVRHPNLITPIGICPESRSLVCEYLKNGSLEDRLACKDNTFPIPWQTRTKIAIEICTTLIFLHSNKPCIVHGNLKPSNILLDANFVSKIGDLGISHLIARGENPDCTTKVGNKSIPKTTSLYMDPQYLETGNPSPESDVYAFGIIVLQLLTGKPALDIVNEAKCAFAMEKFTSMLDYTAGDWPLEPAQHLADLGLKCCEKNYLNRQDLLSKIWSLLDTLRALCTEPTSASASKEPRRIPPHFVCPIFQEVMKDPYIAADGFTYEGEAIKGWLKDGQNRSPMTNLKLNHCNLVPNHALYNAIQDWKQHW